jgi:hypothetical protein
MYCRRLGTVTVVATLIVAGCGQVMNSSAPLKGGIVAPPCGSDASQVGTIGYLTTGRSAQDIAALHISVVQFATHAGLVFVPTDSQGSPSAEVSTLTNSHLMARAAFVTAQASDPSLRTCAYDLSDKPRAAALARAAKDALVASGEATSDQLDAVGVVTTISDDPLDASLAIVVVRVAGGPVSASGLPVTVTSSVPLVVLVNPGRGTVDAVGTAVG